MLYDETPEQRAKRIECLRQQVQGGTYQLPSGEEIARRRMETIQNKPLRDWTELDSLFVTEYFNLQNDHVRAALRTQEQLRHDAQRANDAVREMLDGNHEVKLPYLGISNAISTSAKRFRPLSPSLKFLIYLWGGLCVFAMAWVLRGGG